MNIPPLRIDDIRGIITLLFSLIDTHSDDKVLFFYCFPGTPGGCVSDDGIVRSFALQKSFIYIYIYENSKVTFTDGARFYFELYQI